MDESEKTLLGPVVRHVAMAVLLSACAASVSVAQIDPRTALLEKAGWEYMAAGRARAASDAFRDALAGDPRNPRLHLGAGAAAYSDRRDLDARMEIERALSLAPGMFDARMLLGRVQYRIGDLQTAIATLEGVVADAPSSPEARATLDRWRREAALHDRMRQVVSGGFTVSFDGPSGEALASGALASLDRAYWRVGALLGVFPSQPIAVVLYSTEEFADITQLPAWAVGAYDGTIRVPIRDALKNPTELDRVLAHELTHAFVHALAPGGAPLWLEEGLATALEADDLGWAERSIRDAQAPASLQALASGFSLLNAGQARLAYAISALVVRRILDDAGPGAVANLLRDLGDGIDFDTAALHRLNRSLADLQTSGHSF